MLLGRGPNIQPLTGAAKVINARDKSDRVGDEKFGWWTAQQKRGNRQHKINHQQEHRRRGDVGGGCGDGDSGSEGEGMRK